MGRTGFDAAEAGETESTVDEFWVVEVLFAMAIAAALALLISAPAS